MAKSANMTKLIDDLKKDLPDTPIYAAKDFKSNGFISLGLVELDRALRGGISEGTVNILYGDPHSGKSSVAMLAVASVQRKYPEGVVVYIDSENAFPENDGENYWPALLGCDPDRLLLIQQNESAEVSNIIDSLSARNEVKLIILDSIGTLVPSKELNEATQDAQVALVAKDMSKMINKFVHNGLKSRRNGNGEKTLIIINHYRDKIGGKSFIPVEVLPGGTKQRFSAKTIIKFAPMSINKKVVTDAVTKEEIVQFSEHTFKIRKHRSGDYTSAGTFQIQTLYDNSGNNPIKTNIDQLEKAYAAALNYGLIKELPGEDYELCTSYPTTVNGFENLIDFLTSTEAIFDDLVDCIIMIDRGRSGRSIVPPDGWLRAHHESIPDSVFAAITDFGPFKGKKAQTRKKKK